jgi:hypothetical protein
MQKETICSLFDNHSNKGKQKTTNQEHTDIPPSPSKIMDKDTLISVCVIGGFVFVLFFVYIATTCVLYSRSDTLNSNQRIILQTAFNATLDEQELIVDTTYSTRHLVQFDSNLRRVYGMCEIAPEPTETVTIDIHKISSGNAISLLTSPIVLTNSTSTKQLHNFSTNINAKANLLGAGDIVEITASSSGNNVFGLLVSAQIWAPQETDC